MPSGFKTFGEEDFDRVFLKETEIIDRFVGQRLWTWGNNPNGVLGDGTATARSSPGITAGGGVNWASVSIAPLGQPAGPTSSQGAGIKTDGTLWTWGDNYTYGSLGDGTTTRRSSPGTTAGGGTNWKQVSVGGTYVGNANRAYMAAIKTDGTLWTWGDNYAGQNLGDGTATARSSPGTTAGGGTNWKQVACGTFRTNAAIKTDGTLWTWGNNESGQLGTGNITARSSPGTTVAGGTTWKQVSCGYKIMAAIKTDGTLWTWGFNTAGELGTGNTTSRSSPGQTAAGGTTWKQVSCGTYAMNAVKTDGTLWVWGSNNTGSLGTGDTIDRTSPVQIAGGGTTWKQSSMSWRMAAAVKTDGTLWTWGLNSFGNLGTSNITQRSSPGTTVFNNINWKSVFAAHNLCVGIGD